MPIVCPHCTTSYAIKASTLGEAGRTVRCSRCKETWLARPEDVVEEAAVPALATAQQSAGSDLAAEWEAMGRHEDAAETPVVDSPSISADWPAEGKDAADWPAVAEAD
ncbi:zinc-ribbon domain-containing protein, partial [Bradyrhizobium sp. Arg68]|uniref:MJ0042-type zinc finger domain-containing protein n=1 Tax=Bradyrhizobium ivorense TaxID=2511166 RepID=UPI001E5C4AC5